MLQLTILVHQWCGGDILLVVVDLLEANGVVLITDAQIMLTEHVAVLLVCPHLRKGLVGPIFDHSAAFKHGVGVGGIVVIEGADHNQRLLLVRHTHSKSFLGFA